MDLEASFIFTSRLNWSYLVNTAITGTLHHILSPTHMTYDTVHTILIWTNGIKKSHVEGRPIIFHWNAVPNKDIAACIS